MDETLLFGFSDEEREQASALLEGGDLSPKDVVRSLFRDVLSDPLLAVQDVHELTGLEVAVVETTLSALVSDGVLESDDKTQRPFDHTGTVLYRDTSTSFSRLACAALETAYPDGSSTFQTNIDGRVLRQIAQVDRLDALTGEGMQREELQAHAQDIANGVLAGKRIPNAVLLVMLDDAVQFADHGDSEDDSEEEVESFITVRPLMEDWVELPHPMKSGEQLQRVRLAELAFPYRNAAFDREKNIVIVDGQQRTAALSLVSVDECPVVPLTVNLVIGDAEAAKDNFRIANNAKPIKTEFKLALLASMDAPVGFLPDDRVPAQAVHKLAVADPDSPFHGLVKYPGLSGKDFPIAYNTLFKAVAHLHEATLPGTDEADDLAAIGTRLYALVKEAFPKDWGLSPKQSKLMAGVGLSALNRVLTTQLQSVVGDSESITETQWETMAAFVNALSDRTAWSAAGLTDGATEERAKFFAFVSDKQNTSADIAKVLKKLIRIVKEISAARRRRDS